MGLEWGDVFVRRRARSCNALVLHDGPKAQRPWYLQHDRSKTQRPRAAIFAQFLRPATRGREGLIDEAKFGHGLHGCNAQPGWIFHWDPLGYQGIWDPLGYQQGPDVSVLLLCALMGMCVNVKFSINLYFGSTEVCTSF